jgi:branched-chain amino acid transport system substrate-binding protein
VPLIVVGTVVALSACTGTPSQSTAVPEVRIGLLGAGSGPGTGQEASRGAELAALVVNQVQSLPLPLSGTAGLPGLGGAKIKIVQAAAGAQATDPAARANAPAAQATDLVARQHVVGLISADSAQATAVASERTERIGVPFLSSVASADFLTERGLDWFFRATPTDQLVAEAALALVEKNSGGAANKIGIVNANDDTSTDSATSVQRVAGEAGDTLALPTPAVFGSRQDPRQAVDQVRKGGPQALIAVASQPGDATALIATGALSTTGPRSLAIGAGFSPQTVAQAGLGAGAAVLHGAVWTQDFAERNLAASAVASLYQRRFKAPMTEAAAETFTAVLTLAQAVDSARSLDAQAIRTALLGLNVPGRDTIMPWGGIRFDQTGQNVQAAALVERITPNAARVVFPQELAGDNT